ncbi:hypothetical protein Hanom_Chr10g00962141 [Helianthus anomalus]
MAGSYDLIQQPVNISEVSKQSVCFFMFVDEENKEVAVCNYCVAGRGSYQSFYRIDFFPMLGILYGWMGNSSFYQILERFLWRKNSSFAISTHYRRFVVFVEAEANRQLESTATPQLTFKLTSIKRKVNPIFPGKTSHYKWYDL